MVFEPKALELEAEQMRKEIKFADLAIRAFTSAAEKLQRKCTHCADGKVEQYRTIPNGYKIIRGLWPELNVLQCPICHGTTLVGPTALELAEKLQNGALAGILGQLNRGNAVPIWVKEIFDKLDNLPGKEG